MTMKEGEISCLDWRKLERSELTGIDKIWNTVFYSTVAQMYAETRAWTNSNIEKVRKNLIHRLEPHIHEGDNILVVGTGTGSDQSQLKEYFEPKSKVWGIDLSLSMLRQASERVNGSLAQADANELPLPSNHFNVIYCEAAPEHWDALYSREVLREFRRVADKLGDRDPIILYSVRLGDGNAVMVCEDLRDFYPEENGNDIALEKWQEAYLRIDRMANEKDLGSMLDEDEYTLPVYILYKVFSTFKEDQINQIFEKSGFTLLDQWVSEGGTPSIERSRPWLNSILSVNKEEN